MPEGFENHIYYEIDTKFQGKGYATEALRLLLDEARKINLREVIITAADNNPASWRVIEKNDGTLLDKKPDSDGVLYRKYKIELKK